MPASDIEPTKTAYPARQYQEDDGGLCCRENRFYRSRYPFFVNLPRIRVYDLSLNFSANFIANDDLPDAVGPKITIIFGLLFNIFSHQSPRIGFSDFYFDKLSDYSFVRKFYPRNSRVWPKAMPLLIDSTKISTSSPTNF